MEHQGSVSNEAEFEHWLASAFENERKRLRERVAARKPQPESITLVDQKVTSIASAKKKNT